eukprot:TRINITY_DN9942_c0_g1_i1.p1 TRINITY_DN9942_c0_g1~~TRINITY_DN9942_c0_g1_i1.p1  ORF type:complete len:327 (-),score=-28.61 TRINITY_DN9942_c0_g1_i1:495-1475(-)
MDGVGHRIRRSPLRASAALLPSVRALILRGALLATLAACCCAHVPPARNAAATGVSPRRSPEPQVSPRINLRPADARGARTTGSYSAERVQQGARDSTTTDTGRAAADPEAEQLGSDDERRGGGDDRSRLLMYSDGPGGKRSGAGGEASGDADVATRAAVGRRKMARLLGAPATTAVGGSLVQRLFKRPSVQMTNQSVDALRLYLAPDAASPLGVSLLLAAAINTSGVLFNPNRVRLEASDMRAVMRYNGQDVGEGRLPTFFVRPFSSATWAVPVIIKDFPLVKGPDYATLVAVKNQEMPLEVLVTSFARARYQGVTSPRLKVMFP